MELVPEDLSLLERCPHFSGGRSPAWREGGRRVKCAKEEMIERVMYIQREKLPLSDSLYAHV